jgi:hypothetical protein
MNSLHGYNNQTFFHCPAGFVVPDDQDDDDINWIGTTGCATACRYDSESIFFFFPKIICNLNAHLVDLGGLAMNGTLWTKQLSIYPIVGLAYSRWPSFFSCVIRR